MNLIEALEELKKGKRIKRNCWSDERFIEFDKKYGYLVDEKGNRKGGIEFRDKIDITHNGWEVYMSEEEKLILKGKRLTIAEECKLLSTEDACEDCCYITDICDCYKSMPKDSLCKEWSQEDIERAYIEI